MPITVVCTGCLKRFQVSDKFAGKKGPCPNCKVIIEIPKEQVIVHAPEEFVSGGKTVKGRAILKPLERLSTEFKLQNVLIGGAGFLAVVVLASFLGYLNPGPLILDLIGTVGLFLISFPLAFFGYQFLREGDELEFIEGRNLLNRAALCGCAYSVLWVVFELFSRYLGAESYYVWIILVPFLFLSLIAAYGIFDFNWPRCFFHYLIFLGPVLLLRGLIGLGWIWNIASEVSGNSGNPFPPPPGMGGR